MDLRNEKLGYKIRDHQTNKIPYQLVLGDKEVEARTITYRQYGDDKQITVTIDEYSHLLQEIISKKM